MALQGDGYLRMGGQEASNFIKIIFLFGANDILVKVKSYIEGKGNRNRPSDFFKEDFFDKIIHSSSVGNCISGGSKPAFSCRGNSRHAFLALNRIADKDGVDTDPVAISGF